MLTRAVWAAQAVSTHSVVPEAGCLRALAGWHSGGQTLVPVFPLEPLERRAGGTRGVAGCSGQVGRACQSLSIFPLPLLPLFFPPFSPIEVEAEGVVAQVNDAVLLAPGRCVQHPFPTPPLFFSGVSID